MQKRTGLLLAAGTAALLAMGGIAGLARADMEDGGQHMSCQEGHGMRMMGHRMMDRQEGALLPGMSDQDRQKLLVEFDLDKNGSLSLAEFKPLWLKLHDERAVREFQFFDRDGNAEVTLTEYQTPPEARDVGHPDGGWGRGMRHGMHHGMKGMMGEGRGHGPCMAGDDAGNETAPADEQPAATPPAP